MGETIEQAVGRISDALGLQSKLSLSETRLLLGNSKEFAAEVLAWLLMRDRIKFSREDHRLYVSLSDSERKTRKSKDILEVHAQGE